MESTSAWAAGMKLSGERPLEEEERRELYARSRKLRNLGIAALAAIPLAWLAAAALYAAGRPSLAGDALILALLAIPVLLLVAGDRLVEAGRVRADARANRVERFEAAAHPPGTADAVLMKHLTRAGLTESPGGKQWIELLPGSALVWRVNGARPRRWIRVGRAETATPPPLAAIAAEWVEPVDSSRRNGLHTGQRELSSGELRELRRHRLRLLVRPLATGMLLTGWLAYLAWTYLSGSGGRAPDSSDLILGAALLVVTARADVNLARCLWLGHRFSRDLELGRVVIVRAAAGGEEERPELQMPEEFLAVSGVLWSRAGMPARWRLMPTR